MTRLNFCVHVKMEQVLLCVTLGFLLSLLFPISTLLDSQLTTSFSFKQMCPTTFMLSNTLFRVQPCLAHRDTNIIHTEKTECEYRDLTQSSPRNQSVDAMLDQARSLRCYATNSIMYIKLSSTHVNAWTAW